MPKIILATHNRGKLKEIQAILGSLPIEFLSLLDYPELPEVIEDGKTLEQNAVKKAREIFQLTHIPTLADDTGLEVFYLGMAPGVISARYAGDKVSYEDNNRKLLKELYAIPYEQRKAQFRCVASFIATNIETTVEGICQGRIIGDLRGSGGFGYDPLFMPNGYDQTFAELSLEVKNKISHRAQAFQKMKTVILEYFSL